MAMHSTISSLFPHYPLPSSPTAKPNLVSSSSMYFDLKRRHISRNTVKFRALAAAEALSAEAPSAIAFDDELGLAPIEKPRLVLKFIWMEKNIGLALDQLIPGYGAVPLSPYFFWPRKDAWEELKTTLESKPWISQKKMIIILNQATDIINLWQQSGGNFTSSSS